MPIESAMNTYIGNYCHRKCFNHNDVILECRKKFDRLVNEMRNTPITFKEVRNMINDDTIWI